MRSLPTEVHNPRTPRQQAGRAVFGAASSLAASMSQALTVGLRGVATAMRMSARNVFISLNRQCVSIVEGEPVVDYGALRVAEGELEGVVFQTHAPVGLTAATPSNLEGEQINVTFTSEGGRGADYVYLYAYAPEVKLGVLSVPALRCAGHVALRLPTVFSGHAVHLYGFAWDRGLQASPSTYLGCLELEVDERLEVGSDELIEDEDGGHDDQDHEPERYAGEPEAVAALEADREPMDNHAEGEKKEGSPIVTHDVGHLGEVPLRANLVHHLAGGAPSHLVGLGGVEIGTAAEEESREADEDKGEEGGPDGGEVRGERCEMSGRGNGYIADEHHGGDEAEHVEEGRMGEQAEEPEGGGDAAEGHETGAPGALAPPLVHQDAQAVEAAPGNEVERGTVPKAAEEHGVHVVDVGAEGAAVAGPQPPEQADGDKHPHHSEGEPEVVQAEGGDGEDECQEAVAEPAGGAVAAEGNVKVVAQPARERHVPTAPEVGGVLGLVGRVEVGGQVEAHEHGHADGDVGVAREVGVDLQRVEHQGREVLD